MFLPTDDDRPTLSISSILRPTFVLVCAYDIRLSEKRDSHFWFRISKRMFQRRRKKSSHHPLSTLSSNIEINHGHSVSKSGLTSCGTLTFLSCGENSGVLITVYFTVHFFHCYERSFFPLLLLSFLLPKSRSGVTERGVALYTQPKSSPTHTHTLVGMRVSTPARLMLTLRQIDTWRERVGKKVILGGCGLRCLVEG